MKAGIAAARRAQAIQRIAKTTARMASTKRQNELAAAIEGLRHRDPQVQAVFQLEHIAELLELLSKPAKKPETKSKTDASDEKTDDAS